MASSHFRAVFLRCSITACLIAFPSDAVAAGDEVLTIMVYEPQRLARLEPSKTHHCPKSFTRRFSDGEWLCINEINE